MKGKHALRVLCEVLAVSRSGYYRWQERRPTQRQRDDARLTEQIAAAHARSRHNYGAPRIVRELRDEDTPISKRRCARLMKARGLQGRKKPRRRPRTTDSRHAHAPAENLLAKQAAPTGANQAWMTDITYIETGEGWLYLVAILDVWSRRVVGWACGPTLHVRLVLAALSAALRQRKPPKGLLHHSDQGVQYACQDYAAALAAAGMICSMSRRGNCHDNAVMEAFFSSVKSETADRFASFSEAKMELFDYLEVFYNQRRRHSTLSYISPAAFEQQWRSAAQ